MSESCPRCNGRGSVELTYESIREALGPFVAGWMSYDTDAFRAAGCRLKCPVCKPIPDTDEIDENIRRMYDSDYRGRFIR